MCQVFTLLATCYQKMLTAIPLPDYCGNYVNIIIIEPIRATQFMQVYHRYPERNILLDTWIVDDYQGEVVAREQQALAWIDCDQISAYQFPDADLPILDALKHR